MRFPLVTDAQIKPASTPDGLALEQVCLDAVAPFFVRALGEGKLGPQGEALALLLFDQTDPLTAIIVLATQEGDALYLCPINLSHRMLIIPADRWPLSPYPEAWEATLATHRWYVAWQKAIGGPPCAAWER